jgi:hypothetical protein
VYVLAGGREIEVSGPAWREAASGLAGDGALSLVWSLSGHGERGLGPALAEIRGAVGEGGAAGALAYRRASSARARLAAALARPPLAPPCHEGGWPEARAFLTGILRAPGPLVDLCHGEGILRADRWGSALFLCEGGRGCFRMNHPGALGPWDARHPRASAPPFLIRGAGRKAVVTDSPGRALLVKAADPEAAALVLGELSAPRLLLPHLAGKAITVASPSGCRSLARVKAFLTREGMGYVSATLPAGG